ncbi:unnamed protein product [Acanthoscelides obtectus]|nr:unnamed protein product [Acanthoscelides obtectus]CAH1973120.1 unnamed protein product [Acanthoscelides obtectus]CAK1647606.1 Nose resistant to fluoxetine protein 6 [Acanthoscelides obtectus]CAK1647610.1 Nose resistant to fluoxetine protein 6 [Acanthoscelides obtectus]
MGNFEECLSIVSKDHTIKGQYCLKLVLPIPNLDKEFKELADGLIGYPVALCVPRQCSAEEINEKYKLFPDSHFYCHTEENRYPPMTKGVIATICFLCTMGLMMVLSTAYDVYCRQNGKAPASPALIAFSVYTNTLRLMDTKNKSDLSCISGIKFFSMIWIVLGHVFTGYLVSPFMNLIDILDYEKTTRAMFQHGTTFAVDTFLCLAGLLVVYNFLQAMQSGKKFNIFLFYLHRYLRLTPALAALILVTVYLLDYMGSGPRWALMRELFQKQCEKYWWTSLLYIQNYANEQNNICLSHTWYLSVDTQLYFFSPILLILLWKYPTAGITLLISATFGSMVAVAYLTYEYKLPALYNSILIWANLKDFTAKYYFKTHTRMSAYLIGAIAGYILHVLKGKKYHISRKLLLVIWTAMLALMLGCIFAGHDTMLGPEYRKWDHVFYNTFVRPTWSIFIAWMVVACVLGHGGIINSFLSNKIFQVLSRFSYSVYLIHFVEICLWELSRKTGVYFTEVGMLFDFWGHFMFSLIISYIWVLAFEAPVTALEKLLLR